jgi:hypothetical protein
MEAAVMHRATWQRVCWQCSALLGQLSAIHIAAAGLMVLWASLLIMIDYPLHRDTQHMTAQLAALPRPAHHRPVARPERRDVAAQFAATLPAFATYPDQLRELNRLADTHGVVITRIDYQYAALTPLPIRRLMMRMAIRGADLSQRRFLQAMLNTLPNLSIARLAYAKAPNDTLKVELKLEVCLYYPSKAST